MSEAKHVSLATALLGGVVFGSGLLISGMSDPAKVLAFLDLAGAWDPALILVMAGAIAVAAPAFALARRRRLSWLGRSIQLPEGDRIDRRLLLGSALFGIGWGIAGFCPGPALVTAARLEPKALLFVLAMLLGMGIFEILEHESTDTPKGNVDPR